METLCVTGTGKTLCVTGTGFIGTTRVKIGLNDVPSYTVISDTQITATLSPGSEE